MSLPQLLADALATLDWSKVNDAYAVLTGVSHGTYLPAAGPAPAAKSPKPPKPKAAKKTPARKGSLKLVDPGPLPGQLAIPFEADGDSLDSFRVPARKAAAKAGNAFDPRIYEALESPAPEELSKKPLQRDRAAAPDFVTVACERCKRPFSCHPMDLVSVGGGEPGDEDDVRSVVCPKCGPTG